MKKLRIAAAFAMALAGLNASAGTMAEYRAKCKMNLQHRFKFEGLCTVNFGIESAESQVIKYVITPPEGGDAIEVRIFPKRTATVNGTPAKEIAVVPGWFHFEASNGIDLRFTKPPKDVSL